MAFFISASYSYDSTNETGSISPIFDDLIIFTSGASAVVSTDVVVNRIELMLKEDNREELNVRSNDHRFRFRKNQTHPLMVEHESGSSRRWMEFSQICSSGDFSVNGILRFLI